MEKAVVVRERWIGKGKGGLAILGVSGYVG